MLCEARDVLYSRLTKVFGRFPDLHPDLKQPKVFKGFPVTEPPFYVAVDEIAEPVATTGAVTGGHDDVTFGLHVWLFAKHSDLEVASSCLLAYIETVIASVMADPQLCRTVDNAVSAVDSAGTAAESDNRYIAAASITVECRRFSYCPREIREIVLSTKEEIPCP